MFQGFVDGFDSNVVEDSLLGHVRVGFVETAHCFVGGLCVFVADQPVVHVSAGFHLAEFPAKELLVEPCDG